MHGRILRLKQVAATTGLARSTIYARIKDGDFPTPIAIGIRAVGWLESDIAKWVDRQIERSRRAVT